VHLASFVLLCCLSCLLSLCFAFFEAPASCLTCRFVQLVKFKEPIHFVTTRAIMDSNSKRAQSCKYVHRKPCSMHDNTQSASAVPWNWFCIAHLPNFSLLQTWMKQWQIPQPFIRTWTHKSLFSYCLKPQNCVAQYWIYSTPTPLFLMKRNNFKKYHTVRIY